MNILFFLILYLIQKISSEDYEKLDLTYTSPYYYITMNFPYPNNQKKFVFSTNLPKSFYPSSSCTKCKYIIINYEDEIFKNSTKNISIPYYQYNFIGKEFNASAYTEKFVSQNYFCSFDNLTYASQYAGNGRFSLSYLNYNFNTEKKIFAIKFTEDGAELHLGGYDNSVDIKSADNFKVTVDYVYENYTEEIEYKNKSENTNNMFYENNFLSELNDNNDTIKENITIEIDKSKWYINFTKLKIKTENEVDVDNPLNSYKLTLDMSYNKFLIPRNFFLKNVQKIFPKDAKCQLARDGYFICQCDEDYKTKFGSFVFETDEGTKFYVNVTDYMTYQSSVKGSQCEVHLLMNYENDLFIGGITVLNNYYSIFDVDNSVLKILPRDDLSARQTTKFLILFFSVLVATILILFGGYYFYNKYIINEPTIVVPQNNGQNNNHNNNNNNYNEEPM